MSVIRKLQKRVDKIIESTGNLPKELVVSAEDFEELEEEMKELTPYNSDDYFKKKYEGILPPHEKIHTRLMYMNIPVVVEGVRVTEEIVQSQALNNELRKLFLDRLPQPDPEGMFMPEGVFDSVAGHKETRAQLEDKIAIAIESLERLTSEEGIMREGPILSNNPLGSHAGPITRVIAIANQALTRIRGEKPDGKESV